MRKKFDFFYLNEYYLLQTDGCLLESCLMQTLMMHSLMIRPRRICLYVSVMLGVFNLYQRALI